MNIPNTKKGFDNNFQRKMVPVPDQPLPLKWKDPIQRSLVIGRGRSLLPYNGHGKQFYYRLLMVMHTYLQYKSIGTYLLEAAERNRTYSYHLVSPSICMYIWSN